jgi:Protein of unknown function (DUF3684)
MHIDTAFYATLGSPRLSSLIRENYQKSGEVTYSNITVDIRSLVLERLPIFLHGHSHSRLLRSYDWLSDHFVVKYFKTLHVTKYLDFQGMESHPRQPVSATAEWVGDETIQLSLAMDPPVDNYE